MKTKFKDLSTGLKIGVIGGWSAVLIYGVSFIIGLIQGMAAY